VHVSCKGREKYTLVEQSHPEINLRLLRGGDGGRAREWSILVLAPGL